VDAAEVRHLIDSAVAAAVTPAAVVEIGTRRQRLWCEAAGRLRYDTTAPEASEATIFDLASLTKVIATTSLAMAAVRDGRLTLETPVGALLDGWSVGDRAAVNVRHLLDHSSGLPGHLKLWEEVQGREAYAGAIARVPLERPPGTLAVYSDLGFIVLGLLLERITGTLLDRQFADLQRAWGTSMSFTPSPSARTRIAPTEFDEARGDFLQGEVHDENARALGGVAGHAGLFGAVGDVGAFARLVLSSFREETALAPPALMRVFATPSTVPGSSRALGWDTMRPTSSCGRLFSSTAIGHTGFTGTSLWIDHERDVYVVLLTNRVHPTRANEGLLTLRPAVHDAVIRGLDRGVSQGETGA
jgi:serine-type D-Ala-D-Ala carboxypeptidase